MYAQEDRPLPCRLIDCVVKAPPTHSLSVFTSVVVIVSLGSLVVTIQAKLLGGRVYVAFRYPRNFIRLPTHSRSLTLAFFPVQIILPRSLRPRLLHSTPRYRSFHSLLCPYHIRTRAACVGGLGLVYLG